ncbi:hypothetical protein INS49_010625 [Diaporthe citri]|uniref:uncharacterized protein n=1 Tax=Diaporthe citri TaxID=83186 RepID=UPI001C800AC5|nr:uncharacterized protein INS49_010625 [Diaporthe citri]KAG6362395.1 hypothetical protein INS49_010625 [Diaporthe citri]
MSRDVNVETPPQAQGGPIDDDAAETASSYTFDITQPVRRMNVNPSLDHQRMQRSQRLGASTRPHPLANLAQNDLFDQRTFFIGPDCDAPALSNIETVVLVKKKGGKIIYDIICESHHLYIAICHLLFIERNTMPVFVPAARGANLGTLSGPFTPEDKECLAIFLQIFQVDITDPNVHDMLICTRLDFTFSRYLISTHNNSVLL